MIAWLIETAFAVTLLMLLVLAVRRPVAHFFGANWAYALWLLPVLRLVLPPLNLFGADMPTLLPSLEAEAAPYAQEGSVAAAAPAEAFSPEPLLLGLWLGGTALFLLWQAYSYISFLRRLGIGSQVQASLAQDIGIVESPEVDGPLAIGLLDRWIVVPADFWSRYSPQEQRLALQHERIHHQREDIFWNMVALAVLALNWFNPIAYAAFRAFRADQELSCDAAVAALASGAERHDYASALVKSASKPGLIAACPLNHAGQLKQRLRMMKQHRRSRLRALGGSTAVAALLLAGVSLTESAGVAAAEPMPAAPAPASHAAPAARPQASQSAALPAPKAPAKASKPRRKKAGLAAPAAPARSAPQALPSAHAAPEPPSAEAPPAPPPSVFLVQVERAPRHVLIPRDRVPVGEFRLVRTRTVAAASPELKARLEQLLARHGRVELRADHVTTIDHQ